MYVIFFHVSGLALLEILFYFLYIGPMETKVFKNTIKKSIHESKELYNININEWINITNISNDINKIQSISENSENERTKNNKTLYYKSLKYWSLLFSSSIIVLIIEKIIPYIYKSNNTSNKLPEISFEMTHLEIHNRDEESIESEQSSTYSFSKNIISKPYTKKIIKTIINNIFLCGFILTFEYLFFNYIILKYKIISTSEIHYLLIENINN